MKHQHTYDKHGKQLCCTEEKKINALADQRLRATLGDKACCAADSALNLSGGRQAEKHGHQAVDENSADDGHVHDAEGKSAFQLFLPAGISFVILMAGLMMDYLLPQPWFTDWVRILWYTAAYLPVGWPVLREALESIMNRDIFSEFLLMSIATTGAFAIGEFPEGVAVMLFYSVGEVFQTLAVQRAKGNIAKLLDQRPDEVTVLVEGRPQTVKAAEVSLRSVLQLKPGEKLALDGVLISETASFNTSALTGESKPDTKQKGDTVLAGMINLNTVAQIEVNTEFLDSKLSKILQLVQNATAQKAPTELFIRKFARIYTPIVVLLAAAICLLPYFFVDQYIFQDWLYRALIFLVISCPCALVISIPLGYFGGIGAASKNGILFKGSNYLDALAAVKNVVVDKTGTMTEGVFKVQTVNIKPEFDKDFIMKLMNVIENSSTHPVATAIHDYLGEPDHTMIIDHIEEIAGHGLTGIYKGNKLLVGNVKLLDKFNIKYDVNLNKIVETVIAIAYEGKFAGYITIADRIKEDALDTVKKLKKLGVTTTMLSGDKSTVVKAVAAELGIENAFGDLLPEDKVNKVEEIKARNESVAFVGDGVNDAPVVALSDVGMAMGGLGSDATIETADVVIQDDKPSKIPMAITIGKQTKKIVWQNIALAFGVKAIVLILGAGGLATMWEAVFADVGVALLAIFNAVRIQNMKF